MAVATRKRTQTNFGVKAVWQYLTWKTWCVKIWILENMERRVMRVCRA